ncbi:sensor histidine kinase [Gemella haemolysans]|uniref:Accessory protein regulator protein C family protein n=2 Tax=Gemella haemolysans TaxID=1379 RepID=C5NV48_9BACL|nr:GHKL domain-containing protein [Gemella haemolysans]EER68807.1 accessory protein regulator protein C family protein [Gemella haemolysans ATCC 10379]KAA8707048.1 GHKL domain-containing protein [Gemella haemolysans]VEI38167.1 sensory histidine kinase DcuS [Gemella haemolysans]
MKDYFEIIYYHIPIMVLLFISICNIIKQIYHVKFNRHDLIIFSGIFVLTYYFSYYIFNFFIILSIIFPIFAILKRKNVKFNLFNLTFTILYTTALFKTSELLVTSVYTILKITLWINIMDKIVFSILTFIFVKLFTINLNNFTKQQSSVIYKLLLFISIFILIFYNFLGINSVIKSDDIPLYYMSISVITFFFILFIFISSSLLKNLHIKIEVEAEKQKLEQQKKYIEALERNNNEIRKFKHDFNNIILGLEGYITNNEVDNIKLRDYFYNNIKDFNTKIELDNIVLSHLNNIKVLSIKNLLTNKIISAQNNDFKVNICIEDEIDDFYVNEMQLSRVLGIFLDNSLEAGLELDNNRFLELLILKANKTIVIQITNSFKNNDLDVDKINESGYSTKGENRGIGLSSANNIISKHNMILNTRIEDNLFKQILTIEGDL